MPHYLATACENEVKCIIKGENTFQMLALLSKS